MVRQSGIRWEKCKEKRISVFRRMEESLHKKRQMDLYNAYKNLKIKQNILYDTYKNDSITIIKKQMKNHIEKH